MKKIVYPCLLGILLGYLFMQPASAAEYDLPQSGNAMIGDLTYTATYSGDSLLRIGQRNNIGMNAMVNANAGLGDTNALPSGVFVKIPSQFLLPPLPRRGIVINLPEMRMYYFLEDNTHVLTFPVGIGRIGKTIPIEDTKIVKKVVNPTWVPTDPIRQWNKEQGVELPATMGPGPDNPLGPYAIYLGIPTYLIHSTIFPESIGKRASFGCIRMHETDIKQFFPLVEPGTPVTIVDMPNKIGWNNRTLYLELHPPLEESQSLPENSYNGVVESVERALPQDKTTLIDWQMVSYLTEQRDGMPHEIGFAVQ